MKETPTLQARLRYDEFIYPSWMNEKRLLCFLSNCFGKLMKSFFKSLRS